MGDEVTNAVDFFVSNLSDEARAAVVEAAKAYAKAPTPKDRGGAADMTTLALILIDERERADSLAARLHKSESARVGLADECRRLSGLIENLNKAHFEEKNELLGEKRILEERVDSAEKDAIAAEKDAAEVKKLRAQIRSMMPFVSHEVPAPKKRKARR